jgi:nitrite reductase/ring-hydroxylating ferredoxin subunit
MRLLCPLSDLPEGEARGFAPPPGSFIGLFAVCHLGKIQVYLNSCPHLGVALDWAPHQFLTLTKERIICATHGAEFRIEDGEALSGPCAGDRLTKIECHIKNGDLYVRDDAGL